jgi:hypothetical protein
MSITGPSFIVALQSVVRQRSKETYEKKTIATAIISKAATQQQREKGLALRRGDVLLS